MRRRELPIRLSDRSPAQIGFQIARALAGSWRESVGPLPATDQTVEQLRVIWPLIARSGAVGLLWRRVQTGAPPDCADSIEAIKQCYRQQVLDSRRYEKAAERVVAAMVTA